MTKFPIMRRVLSNTMIGALNVMEIKVEPGIGTREFRGYRKYAFMVNGRKVLVPYYVYRDNQQIGGTFTRELTFDVKESGHYVVSTVPLKAIQKAPNLLSRLYDEFDARVFNDISIGLRIFGRPRLTCINLPFERRFSSNIRIGRKLFSGEAVLRIPRRTVTLRTRINSLGLPCKLPYKFVVRYIRNYFSGGTQVLVENSITVDEVGKWYEVSITPPARICNDDALIWEYQGEFPDWLNCETNAYLEDKWYMWIFGYKSGHDGSFLKLRALILYSLPLRLNIPSALVAFTDKSVSIPVRVEGVPEDIEPSMDIEVRGTGVNVKKTINTTSANVVFKVSGVEIS